MEAIVGKKFWGYMPHCDIKLLVSDNYRPAARHAPVPTAHALERDV
jgi:hypothetical protein